ncbi:MAG TPA: hypothetical protein VNX28_01370 [Gemmataceae bacterium]|nr:hypothetical protein [Gemmataceae bacterium]
MTRFLGALVIIVVIIGCIGLYLGWFSFGSDNSDGKTHITITVDKDKIKEDRNEVVEKIKGIGHKTTETTAPAPKN